MKLLSVRKAVSIMLCSCMMIPMIAGCTSGKKNVSEEPVIDVKSEEYAGLIDGYDQEVDKDLEAERNKKDDSSLAGTTKKYSNSNLVVYTKRSPNKSSPRQHKIDTITIHCMAGQLSIETCGKVFASSKAQASSNYGIGSDGRIALYVDEKDRSWCSSNSENDNRAVTIEVASDSKSPYKVNDAAYKSLISLVTDICKRNGIKKLVWSDDKATRIYHKDGANMTVHRDFANKACPGDYLYSRMGDIANKVNKKLGAT